MKKLLITRPLPQPVIQAAEQLFSVDVRPRVTPLTQEELRLSLADYDAVIPTLGDMYDARVFQDVGAPRAKLLANFGVGYNHIDVDAARDALVSVSNTPGAVTDATADIAMTLILMSCRRAGEGERMVRSGRWGGWHPTQMLGQHVSGKTVGILGMGRIGTAVARRCHFGFGMDVKYFSRTSKLLDFPVQRKRSIEALAAAVDILVVTVAGGTATHHLVGASVFDALPRHAHFINVSRGEVVNEAALIRALQAGEIAGAGLDVYEFEPEVPQALCQMENITLLPHLGTAALEVRTAMGMMAVDNLKAHAAGGPLPNQV